MGTIQSYFNFNRKAENHRISYLQYSKLYRFIKIQMGLPRNQRIVPKDLLKIVMENFERLNEISGLIPKKITEKFKKKYKKEKLSRPEVVNGLDEIEIYRPMSDEIIEEDEVYLSSGSEILSSNEENTEEVEQKQDENLIV